MAERKIQELALVVDENINLKRKALGLTQARLAEALGVGPDSLSRIEKGVVAPRFQSLAEIANILDCSVADLFRMKGDPLQVSLDTLAELLRPLPLDAQEDIVCLMMDLIRTMKKRL